MAKAKYAPLKAAAPLGIEVQHRVAADTPRGSTDAAEYKHECFPNPLGSGRDSSISSYRVLCA
jgi:hypothetical protein